MTTKNLSGFITDLPQAKANTYVNSDFRIIKEKSYNQKANIRKTQPWKRKIFEKITYLSVKLLKTIRLHIKIFASCQYNTIHPWQHGANFTDITSNNKKSAIQFQ